MPDDSLRPSEHGEPDSLRGPEQILAGFVRHEVGPASPPIQSAVARRLKPEHLTAYLKLLELQEQNRHREVAGLSYRRVVVTLAVVLGVFTFLLAFTWLALTYGKAEVVVPVSTGLFGLAAGAIGGYGAGYAMRPKAEDRQRL